MKCLPLCLLLAASCCLSFGIVRPCAAQAVSLAGAGLDWSLPAESSSSSSSSTPSAAGEPAVGPVQQVRQSQYAPPAKPVAFHSVAVAAIVGIQGVGGEIATPLGGRFNLRGGGQLASVKDNVTYDGLTADAQLSLENIFASVDIFPFGNGFRISPGVTLHNDTHLFAGLSAAAGAGFSLGDADYMSDPSDPVGGLTRIAMGKTIAPRLTFGWGNMLAGRSRFSVPFEIGFQYTSAPTVMLSLNGEACDSTGECGDINSGSGPQNIQNEVNKLEKDLAPFRVYPLITTGISYRFGGGRQSITR